ncbi:hypothetical protein DFH11DRAFT_1686427 [Phellopilus nigrolimitatus]|nr:hypothetical protein DFH11DRAFT_1686427 [Phellopilus nigrolimitatus]
MASARAVFQNSPTEIRTRRLLVVFFSILAMTVSARSAQEIVERMRNKQPSQKRSLVNRTIIKLALFPALLPEFYLYLKQHFQSNPRLAELLASPLIYLLPFAWRVQLALYAMSSAVYHSGRGSRLGRALPPIWTFNILGNAWLLWAFIFKSKIFPKSYESIILSYSTRYVPPNMSRQELEELLSSFSEGKRDAPSHKLGHHNNLCAKLHPNESSCLKNYLKAWLHEFLRAFGWVGVFSALPILLSKSRRAVLMDRPLQVLKSWLISTIRGTAFIVGSINTSWALTCLLQRIIPPGSLARSRWIINGSVGSLWILILPEKRRTELTLYVARLSALCAWRAWRLHGGKALPYGEFALFALSWMQLAKLQQRGEKITGLVGLGLEKLRT